ncbi:hypothetical protein [Phytopseudomonas daroniae]|uniref:phage tail tube protein n=1 Tax=Phytopseudomonas daroniae TaxID=2487519 RepID=UPI0010382DD6|nr:hypothetical protein [Pseudomonas daroniae]TBU75198.1 hypothetical protein DNK10_11110 [Pseudomonas daroniae]
MLVSLQGSIYLATRSALGKYQQPVWVGNAPVCTLQLATETTPKNESFSGNRLQIGLLDRSKTATLNLTLDEWLVQNLALGLYANHTPLVGGTVTGESLPANLIEGEFVRLDHPFVDDLELTSGGDPLVLGTDYRVHSPAGGLIEILAGQATAPEAAYEYAAVDSLAMFTSRPPERWLYLDGINTETGEAVLVDLYRCKFNPVSELGLIHEEYGSLPLTGAVLYDPLNARDANLGGYGRMITKQAS